MAVIMFIFLAPAQVIQDENIFTYELNYRMMFFYNGFWYTYIVQLVVMSINRHRYLDFATGFVPCPLIVFSYSFIFIKLRRNNKNMVALKRNISIKRDPENQVRNKVNATELRLLIQVFKL
ncbi:hypothetical protein WR25_21146 [Diploscapter pachys]|uniref:7TM GPCR serpentine receptor class x (Srx) domain-containing protein n=1 Tax=Diploscapter pachys TaxID=2018661 RepID=A0A2A2L9S6_9BILA|nr:hypothetical protein WR25_21146 [Diploscapter pachys]